MKISGSRCRDRGRSRNRISIAEPRSRYAAALATADSDSDSDPEGSRLRAIFGSSFPCARGAPLAHENGRPGESAEHSGHARTSISTDLRVRSAWELSRPGAALRAAASSPVFIRVPSFWLWRYFRNRLRIQTRTSEGMSGSPGEVAAEWHAMNFTGFTEMQAIFAARWIQHGATRNPLSGRSVIPNRHPGPGLHVRSRSSWVWF
jgi:hypothetical protein